MCTVSKLMDPVGSMLPGGKNPLVNPTSMITRSSNKAVNPMASLLTAKDPEAPLAPGGQRVNGQVTQGTTLLGA